MKSLNVVFVITIFALIVSSCNSANTIQCESPKIHFYSNHNMNGFSTILGSVVDEYGLKNLQGVAIALIDSSKIAYGTYPDSLGLFRIDSVQSNVYKLRASGLGYKSQVLQNIQVRPNQLIVIDFVLDTTVVDLSEVIVK